MEDSTRNPESGRSDAGPPARSATVVPIGSGPATSRAGAAAPGLDDRAGSTGAGTYDVGADGSSVLRIDCADCDHQDTPVCRDCLVTFLCDREDDGAVVVPISEIRAVRLLQGAGLAPQIRHRSRRVG